MTQTAEEPRTDTATEFADTLNFNERPLIVIWEVTQACDLSCFHCRACAQPLRDLRELTTAEGKRLISDVAELRSSCSPAAIRSSAAIFTRWWNTPPKRACAPP
jgi:hypothetical protein